MNRTAHGPIQLVRLLSGIVLYICISCSGVGAASLDGNPISGGAAPPVADGAGPQNRLSVVGVVHAFTGDEMKDAYGQMFGAFVRGGQRFESGVGWRLEGGLMIAVGDPLFPDTTWYADPDSSDMEMVVLPLGGSVLYEFTRGGDEGKVTPYLGIGVDGFFGFERTSVKISRFPEGEFEWNDTQYRYAWSGHALGGVTIRLTEKVRGLVEIRWTQGLDGSDVDHSFSEEEINEGWLEVEKAVKRPDFNFTGWSVSIGARW